MGEEEEVKDLFNKLTDLMALGQEEEEDVLTTAAVAATFSHSSWAEL